MSGHLAPGEVAGLCSLEATAPERRAAEEHAAACPDCRRALDEAARVLLLLDAQASPAPPSEAALLRARAAVLAEWDAAPAEAVRAAPGRARVVLAASAVVAWVFTLAIARHADGSRAAWSLLGAAIAAAGMLLVTARDRLALGALGVASVALAAAVAGPGDLAPVVGLMCMLHELAGAAVTVGAAAWLSRSGHLPRPATARGGMGALLSAAAAAGALAGQAAIHMTCPAASEAPHLFVFHVGGVALAALLAALVAPRLVPSPAPR